MIINKQTRRLIYDSLYQVELKDIERYDSYPKTKVEFSKEFESYISKLIRNNEKDSFHIFPKRKLIVVIITSILLLSLAITAYAYRESIFNFWVSIFEEHTEISNKDEPIDAIEKYYIPNWLPDGYTCQNFNEGTTINTMIWTNAGNKIIFTQMVYSNFGTFFNDKNGEYTEITLSSHDMYYSLKNNTQALIWLYDDYIFQLECPDTIDLSVIEKIVESIKSE